MYKWGNTSKARLSQCDPRLQLICNELLKSCGFDLTITCGYRGKEAQEKEFKEGRSKARFGQSKHNTLPSKAVDIVPYPINWDTKDYRWWKMIATAYEVARKNNIKIRSGAFFSGLTDCPHIELIGE